MQSQTERQILIIQTAFVGDLLLGIPLLTRLRELNPSAVLHLYCRKGLGEFFTRFELVDHVIEVDKADSKSRSEATEKLRARAWDWIICPHESLRSHMLVRSLKAKRKTGYKRFWNSLIFAERIQRPMVLPEALRQLALIQNEDPVVAEAMLGYGHELDFRLFPELASLDARAVGQVPAWASMSVPHLVRIHDGRTNTETLRLLSERSAQIAKKLKVVTNRGSGVALLAPGSVWPTKMWTRDGFESCARQLMNMGFRVILMGAPTERDLCEAISAETGAESVAGQTSLAESAELFALADLVICNDSGAMHIAAAAGVPSVAVFGPTTLKLGYRPWQEAARVVQRNLNCRPCGKHGAKVCPLGTHECMKSITPSQVMIEVEELLARGTNRDTTCDGV